MQTILVIDDDPIVRSTIARILERRSYRVLTAENGVKGLRLFADERPDLVITDIIMPEMEGIGTLLEMRRERPDAKVIAISGGGRLGNTDFLDMAKKLGACAVIEKPFDAHELLSRVAAALSP